MTKPTPTNVLDKPFSEVIFSTGEMVIAQCYKEAISNTTVKQSLIQGSTVKVVSSYDNSYNAFGLITKINNSSLDSIHKPSALGLSTAELQVLQPQVYDLLRIELEIYLFANQDSGSQIYNYPPLKPMAIHDFVYKSTEEEEFKLTEDFSSLINLIKKNQLNVDLLFNLIKKGYELRSFDYSYLVKNSKALTLASQEQIESLMPLLKRLSEVSKKVKK